MIPRRFSRTSRPLTLWRFLDHITFKNMNHLHAIVPQYSELGIEMMRLVWLGHFSFTPTGER
jgi:hypothetical protein